MKYLVIAAFVGILGSLGSALFFMLRGGRGGEDGQAPPRHRSMARALALRVGLSIAVFIGILVAWSLGWISPTGIRPGQ